MTGKMPVPPGLQAGQATANASKIFIPFCEQLVSNKAYECFITYFPVKSYYFVSLAITLSFCYHSKI
ncbi:MAG TPA: hypothetical protein DD641_01770 [Deltaproteobacteria bacterium]|nr:hypothetical protein [Deltaproteobacteria bacterium]